MVEERNRWALEDLSQDVYIWQKVKLVHIPWLGLAALAGLLLAASLPLPWLLLRILLFWLPPVAVAAWINLDGPLMFRQWLTWRRRVRSPGGSGVLFAPGADALAVTATPLCELGHGTWLAAAIVQPPPYSLAGPPERAVRRRAWASLLNTAAAHGVQVDIFTGRHPWARPHPFVESLRVEEQEGALADLARWRLRHFTEEAVERGYETTLVVRLVTGARDAAEAWHLFRACQSAFVGTGMLWEWVSGAYLAELAYDWADPGAALRRFVRDMESCLTGRKAGSEGEERRAG